MRIKMLPQEKLEIELPFNRLLVLDVWMEDTDKDEDRGLNARIEISQRTTYNKNNPCETYWYKTLSPKQLGMNKKALHLEAKALRRDDDSGE